MKRSQAFPSQYLGKDDVHSPVVATIAGVSFERIKGENGEEDKPVMRFAGGQLKNMILNNTNWMVLEEAYGDESDNWLGKPVEVYFEPNVMFGGKRVGGVRVRIPQGATSGVGNHIAAGNGGTGLKLEDAIQLAASEAGITRQEVIDFLKERNLKTWVPSQHTPLIRQLIADRKAQPVPAGGEEIGADEIPF